MDVEKLRARRRERVADGLDRRGSTALAEVGYRLEQDVALVAWCVDGA
jgi:hypothetical protein